MANTIRIKRRAAGGAAGAPASLKNAELAYNEQDDSLYYGKGADGSNNATSIIPIAGPGAFVDKTTNQTIAGTKTFSSTITGSISGNAGTATALATGRTISITGDIAYTSPSFDGTGNVTAAGTLATVNSNVGTFTKLTVNAKGLVTAAAQASLSDLSAATADFSHGGFKIINVADPVNPQDAATKNYVDNVALGLDVKASVRAATTASIAVSARTSTTLTVGGTTLTVDGITMANGDRLLVKNSTTGTGAGAQDNGIYVVSGIGSSVVLTRTSDANTWTNLPGGFTFVEQGTANGDTGWVCTVDAGGTLGTTAITWAQFSGAGTYLAGNGLTLTGSTFSVVGTTNRIVVTGAGVDIDSNYAGQATISTLGTVTTGTWSATTIAANRGGTGNTSYTVGDILYADTTSSLAKLSDVATGSALISGGAGIAPSWGKIGLTTHVSGTLPIGNGGTGVTGTPTNGQLLIGNGTGYTLAALTQGTGITITNASGSITVANASPMVYPGAGIPNSTGSAWGTSYTTSGSGTVLALATGAALTTPSLSAPTFSTSASVTAGTNAQGQGALTSDVNVITTTAANPSGVTLPTATTGREVCVVNKGTNSINIYPASGGTIDGLAVNAAISLPVGGVMWFVASSTTQWFSGYNQAVTGTGVTSISFGSTGLTPNTGTTGAVTVAGTLVVGNGGTGATSFTSNGVIYGNSGSALQVTAAGTWDSTNAIGQLLSVNASGVPTWTNNIDCGTF